MTEQQAREDMCRVGHSLFARGYVHATAGNISVRLGPEAGGGYLITPTDACLGFLDPARLARVDEAGQQIGGDRASKTLTLHRRIYAATAQTPWPARCVIHTHSTHCVALSLRADLHPVHPVTRQAELLPPLTPYFVMKVGHVPLTGYHFPGSAAAADRTAALIAAYAAAGTPLRAAMLNRLGPNVWGPTPAAAMAVLEELEETARLRLLASEAPSLGAQDLAELRQQFAAHW
jgi:ribulose-5-phosphate 4-epimerase/fuculose-1-phosphate aldolase